MRAEQSKDHYFMNAAQLFNQSEKIATESGNLGSTLSMLTRGKFLHTPCEIVRSGITTRRYADGEAFI